MKAHQIDNAPEKVTLHKKIGLCLMHGLKIMLYLTSPLPISISKANDDEYVASKLYSLLRVRKKELLGYSLYKRSVDARAKSNVHFVCSYVVDCAVKPLNAAPFTPPVDALDCVPSARFRKRCVVVGAGPAGLFAALYLAKSGLDVTVVEQGKDVLKRNEAVTRFFDGGLFDEKNNVQFGLGGAGTFSDGKLTSNLSATDLGRTVFNTFVKLGAPKSILYDALPHIGTDNLRRVVANFRDEIVKFGGRFLFDTQVTDLIVDGGKATGVIAQQNGKTSRIVADYVILACGHSARDTFKMLYERGAEMQFKPYAVGLRIEHPRDFINTAQYGELFAAHRDLGSASYKLTYKCADGHGCYSFCMCPGGVVVPACSERDTVVVNGMSDYARNAVNSNSALVVTINSDDVKRYGAGTDVFAGMRFQENLERAAYALGGGDYFAPCQNASDFVENRISTQFVTAPSYPRGVNKTNLRELLPKDLGDNLAEALGAFDCKIHGFTSKGVLTGVETRTSSPVKILRSDDFQSNIKGLYPTGEGAGYAGGIVSSAVDGLKIAISIASGVRW